MSEIEVMQADLDCWDEVMRSHGAEPIAEHRIQSTATLQSQLAEARAAAIAECIEVADAVSKQKAKEADRYYAKGRDGADDLYEQSRGASAVVTKLRKALTENSDGG